MISMIMNQLHKLIQSSLVVYLFVDQFKVHVGELTLTKHGELIHRENSLHFGNASSCVSFFYAPNCINAPLKFI